jgi:dipeptidyl aminopeptidase/acylaminoacyl peptidase
MERDICSSALYQEAETCFRLARRPGTGQISDAGELDVSPDGRAVFTGVLAEPDGKLVTRICRIDLRSGDTRVLTAGSPADRSAKFSPNGRWIAFLSDRRGVGDFQLYLLDSVSGAISATPRVDGWVEYLKWSPDGSRILLGVAGHGADVTGVQGAIASKQIAHELPAWMPSVDAGEDDFRWRHVWLFELAANCVYRVKVADANIWEAAWFGNDALAAVISRGPGEDSWYTASLHIVDIRTARSREVYRPRYQLGLPCGSPSGKHVAVVEAVCSDRGVVAGDLLLLDTESGEIVRLDTRGLDVSHAEWRSDERLLLAGHRGFQTIVGLYDTATSSFAEKWVSEDITTGPTSSVYAKVAGIDDSGDCALVGEGFARAPEIAVIRDAHYLVVRSLSSPADADHFQSINSVQPVSWYAPDDLEIQGWLVRPHGQGPHPLVMVIHGGPVFHYRPTWSARGSAAALMLIRRGCALFMPNPRGSSGRGQDFARRVVGDIGGNDTHDYLSGIDHLVAAGIANPERLGVMGLSYGGFMTSWLVTQDSRFAAAVSVAPQTNHISHRLTSNIPHFVELFVADSYAGPASKCFERSPVFHAHNVKTPTLNVSGALDRCNPAAEALQFHNALLTNGVESVLLTYPREGHGIRSFPAVVDYAARVVGWFQKHLILGMETNQAETARAS